MLALGGYHALAQTASQADIVMHSRIFYYARISGTTIPYAGYRDWLRATYQSGHQPARLWEWDLLEALCNHRDKLASGGGDTASLATRREEAAAEKARWARALLAADQPSLARPGTGAGSDGGAGAGAADESTPSWMAAAPKTELYVDRTLAANEDGGDDSSPAYPERFAAIIKAVQTGEPVEGIVEIPDIVARNPVSQFPSRFYEHVVTWLYGDPDILRPQLHLGRWPGHRSPGRRRSRLRTQSLMLKGTAASQPRLTRSFRTKISKHLGGMSHEARVSY